MWAWCPAWCICSPVWWYAGGAGALRGVRRRCCSNCGSTMIRLNWKASDQVSAALRLGGPDAVAAMLRARPPR